MMTKDEERAVLDQIAELIASTGKDSYISMAFEGCVEIAEQNITNDFGCSFQSKVDSLTAAQARIAEELESVKVELRAVTGQRDSARAELAEVRQQMPSEAIKKDLFDLLLEGMDYYQKQQSLAANIIVQFAEEPASEAFKIAVRLNRMNADKANKCDMLTDYLRSI